MKMSRSQTGARKLSPPSKDRMRTIFWSTTSRVLAFLYLLAGRSRNWNSYERCRYLVAGVSW